MDLRKMLEGKSVDEVAKMAAERGLQLSREEIVAYMDGNRVELSPDQLEKVCGGWEIHGCSG